MLYPSSPARPPRPRPPPWPSRASPCTRPSWPRPSCRPSPTSPPSPPPSPPTPPSSAAPPSPTPPCQGGHQEPLRSPGALGTGDPTMVWKVQVQEQGQEHFCPGVGPRTSARGDYPKVGGQEFPLAPNRGEMGATGAPRSEAGRPRSQPGGARTEEGGPPPEPSPPASLASETLSSYCEPWGQVSHESS